jgi:hypothetical protein
MKYNRGLIIYSTYKPAFAHSSEHFDVQAKENTTAGMEPGKAQLSGQHKSSIYSRFLDIREDRTAPHNLSSYAGTE